MFVGLAIGQGHHEAISGLSYVEKGGALIVRLDVSMIGHLKA